MEIIKFEVLAFKHGESSQTTCDNATDFQNAAREYYREGYSTMTVYIFNKNGFDKKNQYIRTKTTWVKLTRT